MRLVGFKELVSRPAGSAERTMAPNNSDNDERGGFIEAGNGPVALVTASGGDHQDRHDGEFPSPEVTGSRKEKKFASSIK